MFFYGFILPLGKFIYKLNIMKRLTGKIYLLLFILCSLTACKNSENGDQAQSKLTKVEGPQLTYILPSPQTNGTVSVEQALENRRSRRDFIDKAISAEQLSQILWAAYGVTNAIPDNPSLGGGLRTAPSAGALYPFEIYAVIGKVNGIEAGVYKYIAKDHKIIRTIDRDIREELSAVALGQEFLKKAPVTILYSAIYSRMTQKYGDRGRDRYVCMDLGHSAQNIYLQAETLNLGTCAIGAFVDSKMAELLQLTEEEEPLYIMPVGHYNRRPQM